MVNAMKLAIIRVRGRPGTDRDVQYALDMMKLRHVNNCVVIEDVPANVGTIKVIKDLVTWGPVTKQTLADLLRKYGRMPGNRKLTDADLKGRFKSIDDFAAALFDGGATIGDVPSLKPLFRLKPPRKGYKHVKLPFPRGALGNRGEKINELIARMI